MHTCRLIAFSWFCLSVLVPVAGEVPGDTEPRSISAELFVKEMQLLARRNPPGRTKLDLEDSLRALREAIHRGFDGVQLEYEVKIDSVGWNHGLATIRTVSPIPPFKRSQRMPFSFTRVPLLSIPMSRDEAGEINTRKPLVFRGKLLFKDARYGAVGRPPKSQTLFWIRSEQYKHVVSIGTFISEDYAVSIGDQELFAAHPENAE